MKIINLNQNTPEWINFRCNSIGGSDAPTICRVSPYSKTRKQLLREKINRTKGFETDAMARGKRLEPLLRDMFYHDEGISMQPLVGVHESIDYMHASFDGYNSDGVILEIKTCSIQTLQSLENEIRIDWMYQIQHQLSVCGFQKAFLFASDGVSSVKKEISRDNDLIAKIELEESKFAKFLFLEEDPTLLIDIRRSRKRVLVS